MPMRKRRQKCWTASDFALLFVVSKWHHGSEGVNKLQKDKKNKKKNDEKWDGELQNDT